MAATTANQKLKDWVQEWAGVLQPDTIEWCDGSQAEYDRYTQLLVDAGTFEPLDPAKRPNSFLALSDPDDVARRVVRLVTTGYVSSSQGLVPVRADSVCVHGDTPGAVAMARAVRAALESAGVEVGAFA